jgi:chromosome segregation ATPase
MNLKDFKPDPPDFDEENDVSKAPETEIPASAYQEEINTLKIDKLANRVTIISIIIPCLIGAILVYAYLDMKKRVVDADMTKQSQVENLAKQMDDKFNALDVKIAKNRFDLDRELPALKKANHAFEGQIAKLRLVKAEKKIFEKKIAALEKRIANNAAQNKSSLKTIERINTQLLESIRENQAKSDKTAEKIKEEISLFKEEFDARLLELSDYEQQIAQIRKDLSLIDKRCRQLESVNVSKTELDKKMNSLKAQLRSEIKKIDVKLKSLDKKLNAGTGTKGSAPAKHSAVKQKPEASKPLPRINIDESGSGSVIRETPLSQ